MPVSLSHISEVLKLFFMNLTEPWSKFRELVQDLQNISATGSYLETAEKEAEYVTKNNIKTFFYLDNDYPFRLQAM